jgi:hypothetical protein
MGEIIWEDDIDGRGESDSWALVDTTEGTFELIIFKSEEGDWVWVAYDAIDLEDETVYGSGTGTTFDAAKRDAEVWYQQRDPEDGSPPEDEPIVVARTGGDLDAIVRRLYLLGDSLRAMGRDDLADVIDTVVQEETTPVRQARTKWLVNAYADGEFDHRTTHSTEEGARRWADRLDSEGYTTEVLPPTKTTEEDLWNPAFRGPDGRTAGPPVADEGRWHKDPRSLRWPESEDRFTGRGGAFKDGYQDAMRGSSARVIATEDYYEGYLYGQQIRQFEHA